MARVSKKVSAAQREAENAPHRIWKTAIYARLSDFDDVLRDTESLQVQISYIKEYIDHRDDLMLLDVFADKRCTGTNFDRPEFERLLKALQERKINCIVVKDFSRLGRNFVETGQYLEQVFPLFGVRFIAINDNYDSLNSQSRDGMLVPIKSMINEMYSKDLSQKIQSCFRSKEARGEIYTPVPFGYKKDQKNHLVLDEEVSDVVVRIFLWKKSGMKEREIAKKLSAQGTQTPFTRRCQLGYLKNTLRVKDPAWKTVFVTKVLENPIYTGAMVYNRIAYDETYRKIGQNPREGWRMVPDSHPAIISWELFDEISALREAEQAVREERKKWCRQRRENNPNIFKGRIFCKKCGEKLVCRWQSDGTLYFYCESCHVSISEKDLWNGINKELHQRMEEHRDLQKLVRKSSGKSKLQSKEIAIKREIEQASGNIVRLESQKRSGYEQYVLGKISKEKFLELKQDAENEIEAFRQTKAEKEKELAVVQEELQQKKQIAGNTEVLLTADNLQQYVKKVEVDCGKITYVVNHGMQEKQSVTVRCVDIEDLEKQAEAIRVEQIKLYELYADGVLLRDAYIEKKKVLSEKLAALQDSIRTEKEEQECADELDEEIRALTKQANEKTYIGGLTKECVDAFVSMVYLYDDQTMKIEFNCEDVIRRALEKYGA